MPREILKQISLLTVAILFLFTFFNLIFDAPRTLRGEVGGGWALEFPSFLGPVKWERANRRVPFGAQKTTDVEFLDGIGTKVLRVFFLLFKVTSTKDPGPHPSKSGLKLVCNV